MELLVLFLVDLFLVLFLILVPLLDPLPFIILVVGISVVVATSLSEIVVILTSSKGVVSVVS